MTTNPALLPVGALVYLVTDDTFDNATGEIIAVFARQTNDTADEYRYRVKFTAPLSGEGIDAPFRPSEVMLLRDQPLTNHAAF